MTTNEKQSHNSELLQNLGDDWRSFKGERKPAAEVGGAAQPVEPSTAAPVTSQDQEQSANA